jgi:uncharacterized lipoprotein YajG
MVNDKFCSMSEALKNFSPFRAAGSLDIRNPMKPLLLLAILVLLAGCATDSQGNRETAWEAMKRWDESLNETESRIQNKNYQD